MPARRRILLVVHSLCRAGMEQQCMHLARGLAGRGDIVTIACREVDDDLSSLEAAGVRVRKLPMGGPLRRVLGLVGLARIAAQHDLIHCTGWDASLWGRLAAILARRPVIVTEHSPGRRTQRSSGGAPQARLIAWHNRALDRGTYATVVVARNQIPWLINEGVRPESIVRIPNGVPVDAIRKSASGLDRHDLGLPSAATVVVHVARFVSQKRHDWSIAAVRQLRDHFGDVRLLLAGDGPRRSELERLAHPNGVEVQFLGVRSDVPALLALADLAVLPSSAEALPMAMLEALAVGVPQVVTDVGDMPAIINATGGAVVVAADDYEAFAVACHNVLGDAPLAARLRGEAQAAARELDSERMVESYSALFDVALAGEPAPAETIA